jgi:hypothetical protein
MYFSQISHFFPNWRTRSNLFRACVIAVACTGETDPAKHKEGKAGKFLLLTQQTGAFGR